MKTDVTGRMQLLLEVINANLKRKITLFPLGFERASELLVFAQRFEKEAEENDQNPNLSPDGRREYTLQAARAAYAAATTWGEGIVNGLTTQINSETAALLAIPARTKDPIALLTREIKLQEIRESIVTPLRLVDSLLRPALIGRMYAEGNADVRAAIAEAPQQIELSAAGLLKIGPLIDPAMIEEFALGAAEVKNPEAVARLRELALLRDSFQNVADSLKTALTEAVRAPLDYDDPLADMASGRRPAIFPVKRQ